MTGRVLVPGVPHKPQGESKSAVLSLNGGLLPKIATPSRRTQENNMYNLSVEQFGFN